MFGGTTIIIVVLLWTNVLFMLIYNMEFRSSAIEPHSEKLPEFLSQVDTDNARIIRFTGSYLNSIDSFKQHSKLEEVYRQFMKLDTDDAAAMHVMDLLFSKSL